MSNKVLQIARKGVWMNSEIELYFTLDKHETNNIRRTIARAYLNYEREEESNYLQDKKIWLDFCKKLNLMLIKDEILEALRKMIENDFGSARIQTIEIVVPYKQHYSCKMYHNAVSNGQATRETGISQSELKQKLSTLEKNSKVMKTFEGNKCSVCLSNYKEILDEDLHIVVPSCGHPLCCKCADGILDSEKIECPQCRERITLQSFNLMKFNAGLEIDTENQRVFL